MSISNFSTGPRSVKGKAVSRLNALKTGIYAKAEVILPAEDPEDLAALAAAYHARFTPATPEQRCLVDSLVSDEWLLRRFRAIEGQLLSRSIRHAFNLDEESPIADAYIGCYDKLDYLQRRVNATRRSYEKSLATLNHLQAASAVRVPDPEPVQPATSATRFVPIARPAGPAAAAPDSPEAHSGPSGIPFHRPPAAPSVPDSAPGGPTLP